MEILDSFDSEFGSSDTQSNYSRLYSWMANQLGHMTLGLIVALYCYWSRETILTFFDTFATQAPLRDAAQRPFFADVDVLRWIDAFLLAFSMLAGLVLLATAIVFARDAAATMRKRSLGHDVSYVALLRRVGAVTPTPEETEREQEPPAMGKRLLSRYKPLFFWCVVGAAALVLARDLFLGDMIAAAPGAGWAIGHFYAPALLTALLIVVSRRWRYVALGVVMILAATLLWTGWASTNGPFGDAAPLVATFLFAAFVFITGAGNDCRRDFSADMALGYETRGVDLEEGDDSPAAWAIAAVGFAIVAALGLNWSSDGPRFLGDFLPSHPAAAALALCAAAFLSYWALFRQLFRERRSGALPRGGAFATSLRDREFFTIYCVTAFACSLTLLLVIGTNGLSPDSRDYVAANADCVDLPDRGALVLESGLASTDFGPEIDESARCDAAGKVTVAHLLGALPDDLRDETARTIEAFRGWRTGVAIFFMSIAIWWVKEFGNDLVLAHVELRDAERLRLLNEYPPNQATGDPGIDLDKVVLDDYAPGTGGRRYTRLERRYLRDAKWDSRTDAFFYVSGAWIAAGVVTDDAVLSYDGWAVSSELLGLLLFVGFFLWRAPIWAARQQAIDAAKTPRARRLATLQSAVRIYLPDLARSNATQAYESRPIPGDDKIMPLNWLYTYAAGRTSGAEEFRVRLATDSVRDTSLDVNRIDMVEHLIVCGRYGSSRTLLGVALACDAALAPLELGVLFHRRTKRREARYAKLAQIAKHDRLEIAFSPNITFDPEEADFLVIDDATLPSHFTKGFDRDGAAASGAGWPETDAPEPFESVDPAAFSRRADEERRLRVERERREIDTATADVFAAIMASRSKGSTEARRRKTFVWILAIDNPEDAMPDPQTSDQAFGTITDAVADDPLQRAANAWVERVLAPALIRVAEETTPGGYAPSKFELYQTVALALISRVTDNDWIRDRLLAAEASDLSETPATRRQRRERVLSIARGEL